jgi:pseudouridine-5'-phosphate glycosidase
MRDDVAPRREGLPACFRVTDEVASALEANEAVVALESAVLTHGLPVPQNIQAMAAMERAVRDAGAVPATCVVRDGRLCIGVTPEEIEAAAQDPGREKASVRDLACVLVGGGVAGLTVSATIFGAQIAGIRVFATGGIGGVHAPAALADVSADLLQLSRSRVITVCSGVKSILDIPRTLEALETLGVPVFGYRTDTFAAFYLESSGHPVPEVRSCAEVTRIARAHWRVGLRSALVIANPISQAEAISPDDWSQWLAEAQDAAVKLGIRGKALTPYLLETLATISRGRTVRANLALLEGNARLAGEIAASLTQ